MKIITFLFIYMLFAFSGSLYAETQVQKYVDNDGVIHIGGKGDPKEKKVFNDQSKMKSEIGRWNLEYERLTTMALNLNTVKALPESEIVWTSKQLVSLAESLPPLNINANEKTKKLEVIKGCMEILRAEMEIRKEQRRMRSTEKTSQPSVASYSSSVMEYCEGLFKDSYSLRESCMKNEEAAKERVNSAVMDSDIKNYCTELFKDSYSLRESCIKNEKQAKDRLQRVTASSEIINYCSRLFDRSYSLRETCIKTESEAKERLK